MAKKILSDLDFNTVSRILNLPDAVSDQQPATFAQLKAQVEGLSWKTSARVSTQANLNLASPGATIDGITIVSGDRVLVRSQTAGAENGIYIWNGAASAMTRALDASAARELESAVVGVEEGTSAGATYRQTSVNFVLDTGAVAFTTFGTSAGTASESTSGVAEIATQAETDAGIDDLRIVTPLKLATYAGRIRKYTTTIGDGAATSYTVTHNLATKVIVVSLYYTGGTFDEVSADVQHTTINSITIVFSSAPTAAQVTCVIIG